MASSTISTFLPAARGSGLGLKLPDFALARANELGIRTLNERAADVAERYLHKGDPVGIEAPCKPGSGPTSRPFQGRVDHAGQPQRQSRRLGHEHIQSQGAGAQRSTPADGLVTSGRGPATAGSVLR
jgi:hypothetical protein